MIPLEIWKLLHLFFSFAFVGMLIVCNWNSRAAHATQDWAQRALLWDIVRRAAGAGLGTLILLGVMGNLLSNVMGYRMAADSWPRWVNGLWLAAVVAQGAIVSPTAARLATLAKAAAGGADAGGYAAALGRWRLGNLAQSLIYLALLALMVYRWRG